MEAGAAPQLHQGKKLVLEIDGGGGAPLCHIFFPLVLVGTIRKNKPELPPQLTKMWGGKEERCCLPAEPSATAPPATSSALGTGRRTSNRGPTTSREQSAITTDAREALTTCMRLSTYAAAGGRGAGGQCCSSSSNVMDVSC